MPRYWLVFVLSALAFSLNAQPLKTKPELNVRYVRVPAEQQSATRCLNTAAVQSNKTSSRNSTDIFKYPITVKVPVAFLFSVEVPLELTVPVASSQAELSKSTQSAQVNYGRGSKVVLGSTHNSSCRP